MAISTSYLSLAGVNGGMGELSTVLRNYVRRKISQKKALAGIKAHANGTPTPLLEEILNSVIEGASNEHLNHLARCADGKEDYVLSCYVHCVHTPYSKIAKFLESYVNGGNASAASSLKQSLSPQNPAELMIIDALDFIEKGISEKAHMGFDRKEFKDPKAYAKQVLEILQGKRGYRVYSVCSGSKSYSITRPI